MIVSTRGRYALRVMIDLAEHRNEGYIPLKEISERQEISLKYLEGITSSLSKAGLVTAFPGKAAVTRLPSIRRFARQNRFCSQPAKNSVR
ncbi:MAG: Rrf2 family transcriptional regulator [Christensenellales bacterium]